MNLTRRYEMPRGRCSRAFLPAAGVALVSALALVGGCSLGGPRDARDEAADALAVARRLDEVDAALFTGPDEVLARVNGRPIPRREFIARALRQLGAMTLLSEVIKEELFLQEAERRGIEVSDADVDDDVERSLDGMAGELGEGDAAVGRTRLAELYERQGLTLDDVRRDLRRRSRNQLIIARVARAMRSADDATLRAFYHSNRRFWTRHIAYKYSSAVDLPVPEQMQQRQEARQKALRAIELVRTGNAQFEALAMAESDDEVTRGFGGNLGPVTDDAPMPAELKQAIFALEEGEVSEPIENPRGGYHVFQVTRIQPRESFEEIEARLREEYLGREPDLREIRDAFYALRRDAKISWTVDESRAAGSGGASAGASR